MALTRSKPASIFTPEGNSLAVFIDVADGTLKLKDVFGDVELFSDFISGGGGGLNLLNDVVISATLTEVVDKDNTPSILSISTESVGIGTTTSTGLLNLFKPSAAVRLMINGDAGQNRLITYRTGGLQRFGLYVNNTAESGSNVGSDFALRRYTDGGTLGGTPFFIKRSTGNVGINTITPAKVLDVNGTANIAERLTIEADSTATTQSTAVIQNTTSNSGIALVPNGTGAITASIPDGTATGGNARGANSVDLQIARASADQVTNGINSVIVGGLRNKTSGKNAVIVGGESNIAGNRNTVTIVGGESNSNSGGFSFIGAGASNTISDGAATYNVITGGGSNAITTSSQYSTISGGQSNTASTGTHATVVGGQSNVSSGAHSVSGGNNNNVSGAESTAFGFGNIVSISRSFAIGMNNTCSGTRRSFAIGEANTVTGFDGSTAIGNANNVAGVDGAMGLGSINTVSGSRSVALGGTNNVSGAESGAYGFGNQIAIGSSFAYGGSNNHLGGSNNISLGYDNKISGQFAIATGKRGWAYLYGQQTQSSEWFGDSPDWGNAQASSLIARRTNSLASAETMALSLDGTGVTNLINFNGANGAWNVKIKTIAQVRSITGTATGISVGDTFMENQTLLYKIVAGTRTIVGFGTAENISDTGMSTASMTYVGTTHLAINFNAPTFAGGGTLLMRVVSKIELVEVLF